jgi:hypothetical protein
MQGLAPAAPEWLALAGHRALNQGAVVIDQPRQQP